MIELNPGTKTPLYEQLYAALADEIRTGQRAAGTPLPGRRTMARSPPAPGSVSRKCSPLCTPSSSAPGSAARSAAANASIRRL